MQLYRIISSKDDESRMVNFNKQPKVIQKKLLDIIDEVEYVDTDYEGEMYHKNKGDLEISLLACNESYLKKLEYVKEIADEGLDTYFKIENITEEVIYGKHDMSVYGTDFHAVQYFFDNYMIDYVTKDHILDKINLYGIESLTDNDKRILNDEPYIKHIDIESPNQNL